MESIRGKLKEVYQRRGAVTMPEIKFDVSGDTIDRLFILKEQQGKRNLTGNEFAAELLEEVLRERVPHLPPSWED